MTSEPVGPVVYVLFPGTAREAITRYAEIFGGSLELFTYEQFGRSDGPADAVAHAQLNGPVRLMAADAGPADDAVHCTGLMLSLLGTAPEQTLRAWFAELATGGRVIDDLQLRPWGDYDGQVVDAFGLRWLIGFHPSAS